MLYIYSQYNIYDIIYIYYLYYITIVLPQYYINIRHIPI
jgi:hypothetical protein